MRKLIAGILTGFIFSSLSFGAALTANRDTPSRAGKKISLTVADTITIYAGAMVAVDSSAEAQNAADTAGYQVVGRAAEKVDNTSDGETIEVDIGTFGWVNAGDVTDANIGDICYVIDNQTVSVATNGANSIIAGIVKDVDSSYVWVDTFEVARVAGSFTTLAASGASTLAAVDADSYTVNAGAGLDNQAAGSLLLGAATATSVEIADAGVTTDIQGPTTVLGGIDTAGAAALILGAANATSVEIADAGVTTDIQGPVTILGTTGAGLDTAGATALYIGEATATELNLGASDINTINLGALDSVGTVSGKIGLSLDTAASVTLTTNNVDATGMKGQIHINDDADVITYALPGAQAGLVFYISNSDVGASNVITIDPTAGDKFVHEGLLMADDENLVSSGAGSSAMIIGLDATRWLVIELNGDWNEATP